MSLSKILMQNQIDEMYFKDKTKVIPNKVTK